MHARTFTFRLGSDEGTIEPSAFSGAWMKVRSCVWPSMGLGPSFYCSILSISLNQSLFGFLHNDEVTRAISPSLGFTLPEALLASVHRNVCTLINFVQLCNVNSVVVNVCLSLHSLHNHHLPSCPSPHVWSMYH